MALTKKDLKEIKDVVVGATEPYFTAIKEDFNSADERFNGVDKRFNGVDKRFDGMNERFNKIDENFAEVKNKLSSLERRVMALEDIATEHGNELRKIRKILINLQAQKKVEKEKIILLERRIIQLEAKAA